MTREDILAMPAGSELDVLVSIKVFGHIYPDLDEMKQIAEQQWEVQPDCIHFLMDFDAFKGDGEFHWKYRSPKYSTDISAAWEVVEKMRDSEYEYQFNQHMDRGSFTNVTPLIICRAALLTVLEESL